MKKRFIILIIAAVFIIGLAMAMQTGNWGTQFLWNISDQGKWLLPLISVAALIDSVNPCAFSALLLTIAFLFSLGRLRENILKIGGAYILGLFAVYLMIGLGILQALHIFNTPHFMGKLGSALLILLGVINILGVLFPSFPIKLRIPQAAHGKMAELMEKASIPTAFLLGALVGLCEFPCTGGPYLMVLGLLHDTGTYFRGVIYLLFYNMIFVLPLVLILLVASNKLLLEKVQAWQNRERTWMRLGGGVLMVMLGLLILLL